MVAEAERPIIIGGRGASTCQYPRRSRSISRASGAAPSGNGRAAGRHRDRPAERRPGPRCLRCGHRLQARNTFVPGRMPIKRRLVGSVQHEVRATLNDAWSVQEALSRPHRRKCGIGISGAPICGWHRPRHLAAPRHCQFQFTADSSACLEMLSGVLPTASATAKEIRARIFAETRLTASVGVSYNKFLAKLASGYRKPNARSRDPPIQARAAANRGGLPTGPGFSDGPNWRKGTEGSNPSPSAIFEHIIYERQSLNALW
jgi:hypothetical protein